MRKFLKDNIGLGIIVVLSGLILWPLFQKGYFPHHDDMQVIRIFEMRRCFTDFQIPCRWVPDLGYGNGFPLFNYYGVLPYYIGGLLSYVLSYVNSAKALFFIPLLLGGISMYFLAKELFGKKAGVVAGVLFLFAPYRALDTYVRGAIAESFAISLIPLVFYFSLRLIRKGKLADFIGTSLTMFIFLTSHNIMTLIFIPIFVCWLILILYLEKWKNFKTILYSVLIGIGLSAFFILPAYLEKDLVQSGTLTVGAFDFRNNFISIGRLFINRIWGFKGEAVSMDSNLSFQIGWPHWWMVVVSVIIVCVGVIKSGLKKNFRKYLLPAFLIAVFAFSIFMIHGKSEFIWEKIGILSFVQFPWRILSVSIFASSLLGGYCIYALKGKLSSILAAAVIILAVALNWNYFRPQMFLTNVTDATMLSGEFWITQQAGAITDFLPLTASIPGGPAPEAPQVLEVNTEVSNFINKSNSFSFSADVASGSKIDVPVFYFPDWRVKVNGASYATGLGELGRIELTFPQGKYFVQGKFENTPVRTISNSISVISFVVFVFYLVYAKTKKSTK